jgi:L-arabinose isomerase
MKPQQREIWFVTGSQKLYGEDALRQVAEDAEKLVSGLNQSGALSVPVRHKAVLVDSDTILATVREANATPTCIGIIAWMHTFSPAKMWIRGLRELSVPLLHLHTQFNKNIPYESIDMDFMNLNQSAHGGREFGHAVTRLGIPRKVVVGHWQEAAVQAQVDAWMRAARAYAEIDGMKIARFGDSMRDVAVTDGDRVAAEERFGFTVHGYGIGDLVEVMNEVADSRIDELVSEYESVYSVAEELRKGGARHDSLRYAARQELALRDFMDSGGYGGFSYNFQMLHEVDQLFGLSTQRVMAQGYGFGAEGDWKSAAFHRAMNVMADGLPGGNSFMEDYTYDFAGADSKVLGSHMLEICPTLSVQEKPSLEIHPLGIGGKSDPVRLVFDIAPGPAVNVSVVDLGSRFRMIVNDVEVEKPPKPLPKLPVARALWKPHPELATAAAAWIYAGGSHHTQFSSALTAEHMEDLAEILDLEFVHIGAETELRRFKQELRWNEAVYT